MSQETPQQDPREAGLVESDPALEAAYAEKPFRDALQEYREQLSAEGKKALEWLASQAAEKTITAYHEGRGNEQKRAKELLKEQALRALSFRLPAGFEDMGPDRPKKFVRWGLKELAERQIDEILVSGQPQEMSIQLKDLGASFYAGMNYGVNDRDTYPTHIVRSWRSETTMAAENPITPREKNMLRGMFLMDLILNNPNRAMDAVHLISRGETDKTAELKRLLPILERWQADSRSDVIISAGVNPREVVNERLEQERLVYDPESKKYLNL